MPAARRTFYRRQDARGAGTTERGRPAWRGDSLDARTIGAHCWRAVYTYRVTLGEVRAEFGVSRQRVARWADVSEARVAAYEVTPSSVRGEERVRIERVQQILREALALIRRAQLRALPGGEP